MKFLILAGLAALLAVGPAFAQTPAAELLAARVERDGLAVGIAAATVTGGAPRYASHGLLQAGGTQPVDETTLFEAGSLSKIFTSLLLAQMVVDGRMELDRPVAEYLPDDIRVPDFEGQQITLFDLATQSSGLPPIPPELVFGDQNNPYRYYDETLFRGFLDAYRLLRAPGSQYEYSNTGFALLGMALAHTGGASYEALVQQMILGPLGMDETMLVVPEQLEARFASGHADGKPVSHWDFDIFAPAGAYRSTAADLGKFVAAASGQVSSPLDAAFAKMLERTRPAGSPDMRIGLGWMLLDRPSGDIVWHNGKTGGFNAFMGFQLGSRRTSVVLANSNSTPGIEDIGLHLIDPAIAVAGASR